MPRTEGADERRPKDYDDYLAQVPEPARSTLQRLRESIKAAVPEATETISYRLPTLALDHLDRVRSTEGSCFLCPKCVWLR